MLNWIKEAKKLWRSLYSADFNVKESFAAANPKKVFGPKDQRFKGVKGKVGKGQR